MKKKSKGWMNQADRYLDSAKEELQKRPEIAHQNAQKAGEFALKALHIEFIGDPRRDHNIEFLIGRLKEFGVILDEEYQDYFKDFSALIKVKSQYLRNSKCSTSQDSYPTKSGIPPKTYITKQDAIDKLNAAKNIINLAKRKFTLANQIEI